MTKLPRWEMHIPGQKSFVIIGFSGMVYARKKTIFGKINKKNSNLKCTFVEF